MAVDFFDEAAVEKLSKDYIAAKDAGDKELADCLYSEMREMHKRMSKEGWTFRGPVIKAKKKSHKRSEYRYRKPRVRQVGSNDFNMKDFAIILMKAKSKTEPLTVASISSRFDFVSIKKVELALELACWLGVLEKRGDVFYKTSDRSSDAYDIMSHIRNKELHLKIKYYRDRKNAAPDLASGSGLSAMPERVDLQNESLRLGMSESSYESGHGRKKSNEYNDKLALESSRDRYGLNKKDILEFDLD